MNLARRVIATIASRALLVWLAGLFIVYYLSMAVWSSEAFASFTSGLSGNIIFRAWFGLFFLNIAIRTTAKLRITWPNKLLFFLRLPLYAGFVLFLLSFFMSLNTRESARLLVGEGDLLDIAWQNMPLRVLSIQSPLKKDALKSGDSAIFDYEPFVILTDAGALRYRVGAFPPKKVGATFIHILNSGIGPGIELRKGNETLLKGSVPLRLAPFGKVDTFELARFPYKFYLSILPNRTIKKGRETAREYDLAKPLYAFQIAKGENIIASGETDGTISFDGNMSLSFTTPSDWVLLEAVHDPWLVWLAAGFILLMAGAILYLVSFLPGTGDEVADRRVQRQ